MKIHFGIALLSALLCGCQSEPTTLRGEAELAQEELEDARARAAEVIAESEEDAVEMVADARQDAGQSIQDANVEASQTVANAEQKLNEKLNQLGETRNLTDDSIINSEDQSR